MHSVPGPTPRTGVLIPIRAFSSGMVRLAPVLDDRRRSELAMTMAERVLDAAGTLPVFVVTRAPDVQEWAKARDVDVIDDPGTGLIDAVAAGYTWLGDNGFSRVIVAHADLPRAQSGSLVPFSAFDPDVVAIVPCHRNDGTPVMSLPAGLAFAFAYGPDSARRHADTARRAGLTVRIVRDPHLGYDVDIPEDLLTP